MVGNIISLERVGGTVAGADEKSYWKGQSAAVVAYEEKRVGVNDRDVFLMLIGLPNFAKGYLELNRDLGS